MNSSDKFMAFLALLGVDVLFLLFLAVVLGAIALRKNPTMALLKRNFLAYFTNPTGYVFLCLFVLLSSYAAFWTEGFFTANLANMDQLNQYLPLIMLVFIPAITMSIWAEERRQGTDELLLTMPAADFDIVLGKYLAGVAIFTTSLLFSQVANYLVLMSLGDPDTGLFLANYLGYWMVGVAMLSIGMVASFLTSNLTVGFILGVVFCLPLVFATWAEVVLGEALGRKVAEFSIASQFRDMQSGVVSFGSVMYFLSIIVVCLYLCMVLIGRRHWSGGKGGSWMGGHYIVRVLALIVIAGSVTVAAAHKPLFRWDATSEKLGSLSTQSIELIEEIADGEDPYVIKIEAFLSKDLPEDFVQKRFDLLTTLREIKAVGGEKISLNIYDGIDLFGDVANRARNSYGIEKQTVDTTVRGAATRTDVIFGVAFESGLERSVIPFMGQSLPIEYEMIRALATVTQQDRKTIGVLRTDADLMSGGSFTTPGGGGEQPLIAELRKLYDIVAVDPSAPIDEEMDVLLAVQPSSLNPAQMKNFIDAVASGIPTALFEDPFPVTSGAPGTDQPKRPMGQMAMFQRPEPKGDISPLWKLLDVDLVRGASASQGRRPPSVQAHVVWQDYNPHPGDAELQNEFVWITPECRKRPAQAFNPDAPIVSGLQKLLLLYPGGVQDNGSDVGRNFVPLVTTGPVSGTVSFDQCLGRNILGQPFLKSRSEIQADEKETDLEYVLAAHVTKTIEATSGDKDEADTEEPTANAIKIDVVMVADMDILSGFFFALRQRSNVFGEEYAKWDVDNVVFVLNILDDLAGDSRFIDIRKRRRQHRELTAVKRLSEDAKLARNAARKEAADNFKEELEKEQDRLNKVVDDLRSRKGITQNQAQDELAIADRNAQQRIASTKAKLDRQRDKEYERIENQMAANIHHVQDRYKMLAVVLPPIPPLLIAICVFFVRRSRERDSVAASRRV